MRGGVTGRGFLRGAAVAGGGFVAAGIAACTPVGAPAWTFGPALTPPAAPASPSASTSLPPSASSAAVPFVSQKPIVPSGTYSYEFVAQSFGSLTHHSHHNATDQVGRGLLGAFRVEPPNPSRP